MRLSGLDALAVLEAAERLAYPSDDFLDVACEVVRELIPCDVITFNRIHVDQGRISYVAHPADWADRLDAHRKTMERLSYQHPLVEHYLSSGGGIPLRISDVVDQATWTNTELYREYFAPLGIRHQMVLAIPSPDHTMNVLALNRAVDDFEDRDLAMLRALRPHLTLGCRTSPTTSVNASTAVAGGWTVISVSDGGVIDAVSEADPTDTFVEGKPLPAGLAAASPVAATAIGDAVTFDHNGQQWLVRAAGVTPDPSVLLVHPIDVDDPQLLALTARQRQVLYALADGSSNRQIAERLTISVPTVKKHLQHIFQALGVTNRVAAAARARR